MPRSKNITPLERKFARGLAMGISQGEAMRRARDADDLTPSIRAYASKVAKRPMVRELVERLQANLRIADLDSVGEAWSDLRNVMKKAEDKENYNAVASLMRQRLTGLGALETKLNITGHIDDKTLLERLTGGDKDKIEALSQMLTPDTFEDEETKH